MKFARRIVHYLSGLLFERCRFCGSIDLRTIETFRNETQTACGRCGAAVLPKGH